jgi:aspartyl-tRNA(Asn)/glutamyl-tRNA(Gln) amidotransferase subunit C
MNREEVLKLAQLARIEMLDTEAEKYSHEFESILDYVAEVKNVVSSGVETSKEDLPLRNIMRADENPHESGVHTEAILGEAPSSKDGYIVVKKIL